MVVDGEEVMVMEEVLRAVYIDDGGGCGRID
jgi:hypothetical protein